MSESASVLAFMDRMTERLYPGLAMEPQKRGAAEVRRAAAKAALEGEKAASEIVPSLEEAVAHTFRTAGEKAAFEQARLISQEKALRVEEGKKAYMAAGGGTAGHEAFKASLAGPYSQYPFNNLTHLTDEQISGLGVALERAN